MIAILLALCLALPTEAPRAQGTRGGEPAAPFSETPPPRQPVTVVPEADDAAIAGRLERILLSTGWFSDPEVTVRDGVVFLDGETDSDEHRRWAGALAENTQGTVAVVNRIAVDAGARTTFGRAGEQLGSFYNRMINAWPVLALGVLVLVATWLAARLVGFAARRILGGRITSPLLSQILVCAVSLPVVLLGLYFVLQLAGLTRLAVTVLGGTGILGIIIGFAFRDIAENFLASLLLSIRNPFRSGDLIEVGGYTGIVQNLNTRSTVLLTLDGNQVQIPNATVFKGTIKNYSSIPSRLAEYTVAIGYSASAAEAQTLITSVMRGHPAVLDAPEPLVLVDELTPTMVILRVTYWFDSATYSPAKINSALMRLTKNALLTAGVELPVPMPAMIAPAGTPSAAPGAVPAAGAATAEEGTGAVTMGEGDLSNETAEMSRHSKGTVPEATENLLKG